MTTGKQTPAQGLEQLHQEAMKTLFGFATSARDASRHQWANDEYRARGSHLIRCITRDLKDFDHRLSNIKKNHQRTITSAVLANPHHPTMLAAGGDYFAFLDQVAATISPFCFELVELVSSDIDYAEKNKAAS